MERWRFGEGLEERWTLGPDELAAMRDFYVEKLGWRPAAENEDIVFFKLNGVLLGFFEKVDLTQDARVKSTASGGSKPFSLAHGVRTEEEVDELFALLERRGVDIVTWPEKKFFGAYGGYVADVEGNLRDIACNPYIELDEWGGWTIGAMSSPTGTSSTWSSRTGPKCPFSCPGADVIGARSVAFNPRASW